MTDVVDRSDPDLKYLVVDRRAFNDPTTQAEWTQKRLVWIPHEAQGFVAASVKKDKGEEVEVEIVDTGKRELVSKDDIQKMRADLKRERLMGQVKLTVSRPSILI